MIRALVSMCTKHFLLIFAYISLHQAATSVVHAPLASLKYKRFREGHWEIREPERVIKWLIFWFIFRQRIKNRELLQRLGNYAVAHRTGGARAPSCCACLQQGGCLSLGWDSFSAGARIGHGGDVWVGGAKAPAGLYSPESFVKHFFRSNFCISPMWFASIFPQPQTLTGFSWSDLLLFDSSKMYMVRMVDCIDYYR
jgi:hypothetical protein